MAIHASQQTPYLDAAIAGDRDARRALLSAHGPRVYGLCKRLSATPDDCYQAVWEKIFRALPRFDPHGSARLSTWLYTVTHNYLVDQHRKAGRRGEVVPLEAIPPMTPTLDAALQSAQESARLKAALARLPEAQRRAVVMHYLREVPIKVVAEQEGVPVGTIKSRLHKGRGRLLLLLTRSR